MKQLFYRDISVGDHFSFQCQQCGKCCTGVKNAVMLFSYDIYNIAKIKKMSCMDVMGEYTEPQMITESGYTLLFLQTKELDNKCIFLNGSKCSIHINSPHICRLYPVVTAPEVNDAISYALSLDYQHHFVGKKIQVLDWLRTHFHPNELEYMKMEYVFARQINNLLSSVKQHNKERAIALLLHYKYMNYDTNEPFNPQFQSNMQKSIEFLSLKQ